MATTDKSEWILLDTDLNTRKAILPAMSSHLYFELSEPGSGELKIPIETTSAGIVTEGMFAEGYYRGASRGGFFVDNIGTYNANQQEEDGRVLSISGRGALGILEDAIIYDDGSTATTREFSGVTKASILITLLTEAQARGALSVLTWDFTAVVDSDSEAWSDSENYKLNVGMSLLDVLRQFARTGIDFDINLVAGSFVLSAYKLGIGTDKSNTIFMRVGTNCEEVYTDERGGGEVKNAYRVKYKDGYISVEDAVSIAARRRREKLLSAEMAQSVTSATTLGSAILEGTTEPKKSISVKVWDGVGPRLFEDYGMGDYVTVDLFGMEASYRVLGIQCDFDGVNYSNVVLELNSLLYENDSRMAEDINWLLDQWNTANDGELIEVSYWAAIGANDTTYDVTGMVIIGSVLYMVGTDQIFWSYNIGTGVWTQIDVINSPNCITANGTDIYIGGFQCVWHYDTLTGVMTLIGEPIALGDPLLGQVYAIAVLNDILYIHGRFDQVDSVSTGNMAQYDIGTSIWTAFGSGATSTLTAQNNFKALGTDLYFYGTVTNVDGLTVSNIARFNGTVWDDVGGGLDAVVHDVVLFGTDILAGGVFTGRISQFDGASWTTFGGGLSDTVYGIGIFLTDVYAVGNFTTEGNRIAKYSGGAWYPLLEGLNAVTTHIQMYNQDVYVAGDFTTAGAKAAAGVAAYFTTFESLLDYLENAGGFNMGAAIHAAQASAVTNSDEFPFWEDVKKALRKITWANIKATLKTYFDTLYVSVTQTANRVIISNGSGTVTTDAALAFDSTTKQIQLGTPTATSGNYAIIQGNDSASVFHNMEVYGASSTISPFINGIRGDGTHTSPTAIQADELMLRLRGSAYDGAGSYGGTSGEVRVVANENHTGSAHGTRVEIWATPDGSTTPVKYIIVGAGDAIKIGDGTNSFNVSPTGDLLLTGSAKYERHFILPPLLNGNPSGQPAQIDLFTASALEFATTGTKYAFCEWEIPDDWDGTDVYIEIDWNPNSGAMSGTATVKWDVEYRSLAVGEAMNNGTSVTVSETNSNDYTQYQSHHSRFTLVYNDANQPLTAQDHIFFKISRDTSVANDFGGTVAVTAFEIVYTSKGLPTN